MLNETSYHGKGAIEQIPVEIKARGLRKVFVCSDPDLIRFGVTGKVTALLDKAGIAYEIYSNIKANPTIENVQSGVAAFKAAGADSIVAIGGGTGLSTLLVILLASMVAFYFTRAKNTFSKVLFALMAASMIIPFQAIMIPLVSIYGSGLNILNHRLTLVFMHTGFAMSMSVFIYQGFIKSGIPVSLEEAAYLDGCTKVQTFFKVVFPLLKPTTATLVILNVLAFWNDYLLPSLVLGKKELYTLPLSTYSFYGTYSSDYGVIMAALALTVAPILVLYLFLQRQIIDGVVAGAVKS